MKSNTELSRKLEQHRAIMLAKKKQVTFELPPEVYDQFLVIVADKDLTPYTVLCSLVTDYIDKNIGQKKVKPKREIRGFIL